MKSEWRVGRKVPINVYDGDRPVCQCHNEQDAANITDAMNACLEMHSGSVQAAAERVRAELDGNAGKQIEHWWPNLDEKLRALLDAIAAPIVAMNAREELALRAIEVGWNAVHLKKLEDGDGCEGCVAGWCQMAVDAACETRNQFADAIRKEFGLPRLGACAMNAIDKKP